MRETSLIRWVLRNSVKLFCFQNNLEETPNYRNESVFKTSKYLKLRILLSVIKKITFPQKKFTLLVNCYVIQYDIPFRINERKMLYERA